MAKNQYAWPVAEGEFDGLEGPQEEQTEMFIRIKGLKAVSGEDGLFKLTGMRPRKCDWQAAMMNLGYPAVDENDSEAMNERGLLIDKLAHLVYLDDIMKVLAKRIS